MPTARRGRKLTRGGTDVDRSKARVIALGGQVLAVAAAVGVGWVLLVGVPASAPTNAYDPAAALATEPVIHSTGGQGPVAAPWQTPEYAIDIEGVAARLSLLPGAPTPPAADTPADTATASGEGTTDTGAAPAAGIADRVRYLGLIHSGEERLALLSIDGRQRVMGRGQTLPGVGDADEPVTLENVSERAVRLHHGNSPVTIQLAPRTTGYVSTEITPPPPAATTAAAAGVDPEAAKAAEERKAKFAERRNRITQAREEGRLSEQQADRLLRNLDREEERGTVAEQIERRGRPDGTPPDGRPREGVTYSGSAGSRRRGQARTEDERGDDQR